MNTHNPYWLSAALLLITMAHAQPALAQPLVFNVEDLGALPGDIGSVARGINEAGDVTGWSSGSPTTPVIFPSEGGIVSLPYLPNASSASAQDINASRQVTGESGGYVVRWTGGVVERLATPQGLPVSTGWGINSLGDVVGEASDGTLLTGTHAFLVTDSGGAVDLTPGLSASIARALDINDAGEIAGYAGGRVYRWSDTGAEDLGVMDGFALAFGQALNDVGQIAGFATTASGNAQHILRYSDGIGFEDLGGGGETNQGWGINNLGDVVGLGDLGAGIVRGFIYTDDDGLQDLNALLAPGLHWFVLGASDINDEREISAWAINNDTGRTHAVRLVPSATSGDTVAPTVTIAAPADGATIFYSRVAIRATAADDVGVVQMRALTNGVSICDSAAPSLQCTWYTRRLPSGQYTIEVEAADAAGNVGAASVTVSLRRWRR